MKTVMVLGGSASEVPVIERALALGHNVIVVDKDETVPGLRIAGVKAYQCSISDKEEILNIAKENKIDGIIPSVDAGVRTAAYVARVLNIPGISENAAILGTDKTEMRKRIKEQGIPVPEFYIARTFSDYLESIQKFESKCIVKAADSSGSRGIYLIEDITNFNDIKYAYDYCLQFSSTGQLLVEEFMEGLEICVETLNANGICYPIQITDEMHKEPPFFTDCGYSQPTILDDDMKKRIMKIAIDANLAIENYQGSSCTEMIVTKNGPKIVEIGVRLAGDFMTTKMVPLSCGVDMPGNVVKIALGQEINIIPTKEKGSCVKYFMKERVGKIKQIIGIEQAYKIPGVVTVGILKGIGDEATLLRKSSDRLGYVITQGETNQEAVNIAEKALECIDFIVEK